MSKEDMREAGLEVWRAIEEAIRAQSLHEKAPAETVEEIRNSFLS